MLQPKSPVKYIVNGREYSSLEEAKAALAGGGSQPPVSKEDSAGTLARITLILGNQNMRDTMIQKLFDQYSGADRALQQHEVTGLCQSLGVQIGIDPSFFENVPAMFYRFDYSGDEKLDIKETKKLIKFLLKSQKRLLDPREEQTLGQLERKSLQQNYELGKKLGEGGQGAVYLAKETCSGTSRVVKFYKKSSGNSCLDDIKDEYELLKRLDHPNVARICSVFQDNANIYVISEPYTGGDLVTVTEKAQKNGVALTHNWLGLIFLQVLEGIAYLHSKETMHCDLKEPNVMIADDKHWDAPHCMLIDFGMAKSYDGDRAGGTPGYMPPEFWQYNLWTPKGDMFALAVTFWGIYNFKQGGPFQVPDAPPFQRIAQATIGAPMDCSRFPPGMKEVIQQMAEKDFRRRPTAKQACQSSYFSRLSEQEEATPLDAKMIDAMVGAANRSTAQNLVAMEMASKNNLGQMKRMNTLFRQLDKDDDGTVETNESIEVLVGLGYSADNAKQVIDSIVGSDGKIHYSEFMGRMIAAQETLSGQALAECFQQLDMDGNGTLDRREIQELMSHKNMNSLLEGRTADDLIAEMDGDGDGKVDFQEFQRVMLGSSKPQSGFAVGDDALYNSVSANKWIPCKIIKAERGNVQINVKPGQWLPPPLQATHLRKPGGGRGGGGGYA
jgi:calcium-dependent protein kinase